MKAAVSFLKMNGTCIAVFQWKCTSWYTFELEMSNQIFFFFF